MFRLAAAGPQLLQRLALGHFVVHLIGATRQKLQRRVGTADGLAVAHTAGEIACLVIGLADQQLLLGAKNIVLLEIIGIGNRVAILSGVVVVGKLGLGARCAADRGVA